jgi:4-hydroxybenzoate polyprenyltransferase
MRVFAAISRLHIVAIGALGALTFGWTFFGERLPLVFVCAAMDWFLVNLLNRVVDLPEDHANKIVGTDFVASHRTVILYGGFTLLGLSLVGVSLLEPRLLPLRLAFHALGFAYNWPLLPGKRRIKQQYFWKNMASAIGFILTVFGYPLAVGMGQGLGLRLSPVGIVVTALFFVLFELSYEVLYDLRDTVGDRAADVHSYPVVHGERTAIRIVDGLVLSSIAVIVLGYATSLVPWRIFVMVAAPAFQFAYYKWRGRRERAADASLVDARDCIRLTWIGATMLALYNVWVSLGLPGV